MMMVGHIGDRANEQKRNASWQDRRYLATMAGEVVVNRRALFSFSSHTERTNIMMNHSWSGHIEMSGYS